MPIDILSLLHIDLYFIYLRYKNDIVIRLGMVVVTVLVLLSIL